MIFISWVKFQRRNNTICQRYNINQVNIYYDWQSRSILHKCVATIFKMVSTIKLLRSADGAVFVQVPSVYLLYIVAIYKKVYSKVFVIADCHNNIFYDSLWSKFPFLIYCLSKFDVVIAHNDCVLNHMEKKFSNLANIIVIKDLVPNFECKEDAFFLEKRNYTFIPCSLGEDEPVNEMVEAIAECSAHYFVITKTREQVLSKIGGHIGIPENLNCVGFLSEEKFNQYLLHCQNVLVLTKREGTQPSGAVEALGARKLIIISEVDTTKALFSDIAVFCDNATESIVKAFTKSQVVEQVDFDEVIANYEKESLLRLCEIVKNV